MKKKQLILSLSIITGLSLLFLVNWFFESEDKVDSNVAAVDIDHENEHTVNIAHADYFPIENIDILEERSTLIVNAKYTGNRTLKEWTDISTGEVIATGSESEININEILKGDINSNSSAISVYEPAYFEDNTYVSIEGYNLMNEEDNYLLFLRPMENEEAYVIVGMYQGKYNVNSTESLEPVKSVKVFKDIKDTEYFGDNIEGYNELKTQVLKKYLEK